MPRNRGRHDIKRLPNGIRKHIGRLKAKIRRSTLTEKEIKEKIKEIDLKFHQNINPQ